MYCPKTSLLTHQTAAGIFTCGTVTETESQFSLFSTLTQIPINVFFHHATDESIFGLVFVCLSGESAFNVHDDECEVVLSLFIYFCLNSRRNVFISSDSVMEIEMPDGATTGEEFK